jgi:Predicted site-specific integrase-resolvase
VLRLKEVPERLGISYATLREYVRGGWIKPVESGRCRFREEDVERLAGIVNSEKVILYARVSSSTQRDNLERQVKALEE